MPPPDRVGLATLTLPALILSAVRVNLRGGRLPPTRDDGRRSLSLPLDTR